MRQFHVTSNQISKTGEYVLTASFPIGETCRPDAPCLKQCYGRKGYLAASNYITSMKRNLDLYIQKPHLYFADIDLTLSMVSYRFFRWFVTGDIPDDKFFSEIAVKLAEKHPATKFLMFTKKYEIVNNYLAKGNQLPSNLTVVLSCWGNFLPLNPYGLPMSFVRFKDDSLNEHIPQDAMCCGGSCGHCIKTDGGCWKLKNNTAVVFNKH